MNNKDLVSQHELEKVLDELDDIEARIDNARKRIRIENLLHDMIFNVILVGILLTVIVLAILLYYEGNISNNVKLVLLFISSFNVSFISSSVLTYYILWTIHKEEYKNE